MNSRNASINGDLYDEEEDLIPAANQPLIENEDEDHEIKDGEFPKSRQVFALVGFCGFAVVYAMRVNLSISIVSMVNQTAINDNTNQTITDVCPISKPATNSSVPAKDGEFLWDEYSQGIVLGAFFYGYVLTQIPGGRLAETVGGKLVYGIGVFLTAIFTILTPIAARKNFPALVLVRILEGLGEGVTFPSMHAMLAKWVPKTERSRFAAVVYNGANFGTIISIPLTGYLCSLEFMGGWPLSFYIFGLLGIVWCFFWWWFVYDTPQTHPRISQAERLYIEKSLKKHDNELETSRANDPVPWKSIASSVPLWALLITTCGQSWVFYTQLSELPTYMSNILHFDIQQNALFSALPYLTSLIFGLFCSVFADWLIEHNYISQKNSFKLWNSVASVVPAMGLLGIAWAGCDRALVLWMLIGFGAFAGANSAGTQMNHIFLSPQYAGTLYGITNGAGNLCGFLAPYFIGSMISGRDNIDTWTQVFGIAAFISVITNFVFLAFGDDQEQAWSKRRNRIE